ncbi:MAG: nitrogenase iron-molybdenum cofactor biosynthesis protein NifE [Gloeomargarita sp. SKYBB_i_bin120]|nr:nitrogenase iron-molybdenum cofactor biosynthesis protein NifE [Gloeomargarita sp. SKYB120]MDW8178257.1 nitrogenase iron-molybdenum cofactor biosynthesis protein NifE [Gloeomargarita sp. SKYBB_i_bin120]
MFRTQINQLLTEPACPHNHHQHGDQKNRSCRQQAKPGAAQGGCAFDGASITLVPITDAAHLVHGPIACAGNSWGTRGSGSSGPLLFRTGFTTDLTEQDIIFGGEKRLYRAIQEIAERYRPAAIFVYCTCVPALTGEDVVAVCQAAREKVGLPVIPVMAPGFVGGKNLGNRLAGEALLEYVIGTGEPPAVGRFAINLIGEYNIAGELWDVLPLFERLGIQVLAKITGDARYREITYAHRAHLNLVICAKALLNVARKMQERYGIPYIEGSFYGLGEMNRCLRQVAQHFQDPDLSARVEALIAEETQRLEQDLAPYRAKLQGKRVVLYTGGVKSWSVIAAAQDLGMRVVASSTRKSTAEDKARIQQLLGDEGVLIEGGGTQELLEVIRRTRADLLIAGGRNQYTALKAGIPFLDINQERHHGYAGYRGLVTLARELTHALYSPVWTHLRQPAPWEEDLRYGSDTST